MSDNGLKVLLEKFFMDLVKDNDKVKILVIDIVKNIIQLNSVQDILNTNIKEN
jgi:hypothetical protein